MYDRQFGNFFFEKSIILSPKKFYYEIKKSYHHDIKDENVCYSLDGVYWILIKDWHTLNVRILIMPNAYNSGQNKYSKHAACSV